MRAKGIKPGWDYIFGGVADKSWATEAGGNTCTPSDSAFLFCISCGNAQKSKLPHQIKLTGQNDKHAIRNSEGLQQSLCNVGTIRLCVPDRRYAGKGAVSL